MQRKIVPDVIRKQKLLHLSPTASVRQAARRMKARHVGAVLVVDDGRLVGIFTERDLVCRVVAENLDPDGTSLSEVMTRDPDTVSPHATAVEALRTMQDGGYRHLPVVESGRLIGIVSRRDFFGAEKAQLDNERAVWERLG